MVVGRDRELELLARRLEEARDGSGGLLFLVGEAGIGKSRLTREVEARARDAGMRVLRGRAVPEPAPYRALVEAFHGAVRQEGPPDAPELRPFRVPLSRLIPEWRRDQDHDPSETSGVLIQEAILRLLLSLAGNRGLLLVLEDLHWAEGDTLAALDYLSDHLADSSIMCLATLRPEESGGAASAAGTMVDRRAAERIVLDRLSAAEVRGMTRACLDGLLIEPPPAGALDERGEGVPFVIEEMLSAYVAAGGDQEAWARAVPPSFRELVRARLSQAPEEARSVVSAAAVLGRTFDWSLLAAITDLEERAVLEGLRAGVEAQLIEAAGSGAQTLFGFRHALMREAVLAELLPPEHGRLALRAADEVERRFPGVPGEWCERAAGLRETGGDALGAALLLLEAGRRALSRAALASAEATLVKARALAEEDPWLVMGIDERLLETLSLSGRADRLREVGDRLERFWDREDRQRFAEQIPRRLVPIELRLARGLANAGDWSAARAHLARARALLEPRETVSGFSFQGKEMVPRVAAFAAHAALAEGDPEEAERLARQAEEEATALGLREVACEALDARGRAALDRGNLDGAAEAFDREAGVAGEDLSLWGARARLGLGTIDGCRTGDPDRLIAALALLEGTEAVSLQVRVEVELGRVKAARLDLGEADDILGAAVERCGRFGIGLLPAALAARATVAALSGREADADHLAREALGQTEEPLPTADALAARGVAALVAGRRSDAVEQMGLAVEQVLRARPAEPRGYPGLYSLLAGGGAVDGVRATPHAAHAVTEGCLALSRWIAGGGSVDWPQEVERALAPFPWERNVGRLIAAEAGVGAGWGDPAGWAREALLFFEEAGHVGLAGACKRVLRRAGVPVPRRGRGSSEVPEALRRSGVTSREMDILTLVAQGLSNAAIAERLYLSTRTVESHVSSLLRKTGAETRERLATLVAEA